VRTMYRLLAADGASRERKRSGNPSFAVMA
jgi:hypothetical protein